jgi:hypothetical protein
MAESVPRYTLPDFAGVGIQQSARAILPMRPAPLRGPRATIQVRAPSGQVRAYRDAQPGLSEPDEDLDEDRERDPDEDREEDRAQDSATSPPAEPIDKMAARPALPDKAEAAAGDASAAKRKQVATGDVSAAKSEPTAAGDAIAGQPAISNLADTPDTSQEPAPSDAKQTTGPASGDVAGADDTASRGDAGGGTDAASTARASAAVAVKGDSPGAILASLRAAPASQALDALGQAQALSRGALTAQRDAAQQALPTIPAPTGLPARASTRAPARNPAASGAAVKTAPRAQPAAPTPGGRSAQPGKPVVREAPAARPQAPTRLAGNAVKASGKGQQDPALARSAQQSLAAVSAPVHQVATRAQSTPRVALQGEANPAQLQSGLASSQGQAADARVQALREAQQDFGERDIAPAPGKGALAAKTRLAEPRLPAGEPPGRVELPPEAMASIDAEVSPKLQDRIGPEEARYAEGAQKHDADVQAAHAKAGTEIGALDQRARAQQEEARGGARNEVAAARKAWKGEIEGVEKQFQSKAGAAQLEHQQKIQGEEETGNRAAARHVAEAEKKAQAEKQKAEAEVTREKGSAEKEAGGFWGWVASKAQALVDALKQAVNLIYDHLRQAVKTLFEVATKLALAAIDLARRAVVGLIKAYATVLKGLVSVALAAFPKIRNLVLARIDGAVAAAEALVNRVAAALQQGVSAVLDFLATSVDKLLGLAQDLFSGVFKVIGMLVGGELKELLARIGHLVEAAKTAPDQFMDAAVDELLGDETEAGPAAAGVEAGPAAAGVEAGPAGAETEAVEAGELPRAPWTEDNVGVDEVATGEELSPELVAELMQMLRGGDEAIAFGESEEGSRSIEGVLGLEGQASQTAETSAPARTEAGQQAKAQDPRSPRERAEAKWAQMKQLVSDWWSKNWPMVLAGGVLGVAGFIVANILTGGAILAALPVVMTVIGALFTGITLVDIANHVREYLRKGWEGDHQGGGKSLARALAAGAIELISWLTFKVGSVVTKGAKAVVKGAKTLAKGAMRVARRGAQYVIRAGKVLLRGPGKGITRGARRLQELGARLLARTRFTGFRIRIQGRRFVIEGRINPWVLLASGQVVEVSNPRNAATGKVEGRLHKGDRVVLQGEQGVVISAQDARRLEQQPRSGRMGAFEDRILTGDSTLLGTRMGTPKGQQAHHLVASAVAREHRAAQEAARNGWDLNHPKNGLSLPSKKGSAWTSKGDDLWHHGGHADAYNKAVRNELDAVWRRFDTMRRSGQPFDWVAEMNQASDRLRQSILDGKIQLYKD